MIHLSPRLPGRAPGDVRPSMKLFAVCAPGLEPFLTQEIKAWVYFRWQRRLTLARRGEVWNSRGS